MTDTEKTVSAAAAISENPLLEIREMQRQLQHNPGHALYTQYLIGVVEFATTEARELLLRQVMRRLVFAVEVMTHEKNFSIEARTVLAETLDIAAIFAECHFERPDGGELAFMVDPDAPGNCGIGAEIIPIHRSYERH